ncbi:MAG: TonB C-terminal domain-containing protein, partial [Halobacteriovoraceae bacterium]|nr:TonB C-terminal domain-containing protein [Halobacteriovoraceae bacterium]
MIESLETLSKPINYYAKRSLAIHIALILGAIICGQFAYQFINVQRIKNVKLIENSVKVEMVAMPTLTLKELKTLSQDQSGFKVAIDPGSKDPEPVVKNNETVFKKVKEKINFQDMLKNLAKKKVVIKKAKPIKKIKEKREKGLTNTQKKKLNDLILKGNKIRKGNVAVGKGNAAAQSEFESYVATIPGHVKPNWKLPSYLLDKSYVCRIRIYLETNGKILRMEVFQSSGNEEYDKKALAAVNASSPFPNLSNNIK